MDQNAWIMLFVGIAIPCALFALGVLLYPKLKREKQGYPLEQAIEAALLPIIFQGICSAYRLSEKNIDELHQRLSGSDKKRIADSIYAMLPEKIGDYDLSLVKKVVPQERLEQLVQDAYNRFDQFFVGHQEHFDKLLEEWKAENKPT